MKRYYFDIRNGRWVVFRRGFFGGPKGEPLFHSFDWSAVVWAVENAQLEPERRRVWARS